MRPSALVRRREALHLSRAQLAREAGVSHVTIWRWEVGKFSPSWLAARQLETTLQRLEHPTTLADEAAS